MSGTLFVPQAVALPSPGEIASYLLSTGWSRASDQPSSPWIVYYRGDSSDRIEIEVPQLADAVDFPRTVQTLLSDLARLESRAEGTIARDIRSASMDIARLRLDGPLTSDGRIPVEAGSRLFGACRDLLLAAACATVQAKPVFTKRKPDEAMALLQRARFGQTEVGSFIVTIESTVAPQLDHTLKLDQVDRDPSAPFERRSFLLLARSIKLAEHAVQDTVSGGSERNPFAEGVREGVSANLCDAVADILDATQSASLHVDFRFSRRREVSGHPPLASAFRSDAAPILREAAANLRDAGTFPDTELAGPVVQLTRFDSTGGGRIVVAALMDGKVRNVGIGLDEQDYERAILAHKNHNPVSCVGELLREGRSWLLRNPHNLNVLIDAESESLNS